MIVVADEDAVAVAVEAERNTVAAQHATEQAKIAARIFGGEEFGHQNFASGVVKEAEQGKLRAMLFEPGCRLASRSNISASRARARRR